MPELPERLKRKPQPTFLLNCGFSFLVFLLSLILDKYLLYRHNGSQILIAFHNCNDFIIISAFKKQTL